MSDKYCLSENRIHTVLERHSPGFLRFFWNYNTLELHNKADRVH